MNPFVALFEHPVATLTAFAYVLLLLSVSIALAGFGWRTAVTIGNWFEHRGIDGRFGPQWQYVPPIRFIAMLSGVVFLAAVEFALLGGIVYVLSG